MVIETNEAHHQSVCYMKRAITVFLSFSIVVMLLSSCSTSDEILKALKIDYTPTGDKKSAAKTSKADLEKQLAAAKKQEAALKKQVTTLEDKVAKKDEMLTTQITELKEELRIKELALTEEIDTLRQEIDEKEAIITLQGKVIDLLDDEDQTLQKTIEAQLQDR